MPERSADNSPRKRLRRTISLHIKNNGVGERMDVRAGVCVFVCVCVCERERAYAYAYVRLTSEIGRCICMCRFACLGPCTHEGHNGVPSADTCGQYRAILPTRIWTRHFPDEFGLPNTPSCRSQKVGISKCKSRADRSKPVGLLVRPPAACSAMAARRFGAV